MRTKNALQLKLTFDIIIIVQPSLYIRTLTESAAEKQTRRLVPSPLGKVAAQLTDEVSLVSHRFTFSETELSRTSSVSLRL